MSLAHIGKKVYICLPSDYFHLPQNVLQESLCSVSCKN